MGAALLLLRLLLGAPEPTAQQILEMVDKKLFGHSDDYFRLRMKIGAGSPSDPTIEVFQKIVGGKMMRLVRFLAPADLRGMGVLAQSRDLMYVYLPGFDKVRRVAAHARAQSFMGSDFIYDDLGLIQWAPDYSATLVSSNPDEWVLDLAPKPDRDPAFGRLRATVSRRCLLFIRIEYFDRGGRKVRTHLRDIDRERCEMKHMAMITHGNGDHRTDGDVLMWAFDKGLPDDLFTVRSLARGN
jgi:outer membrane lipoprotein-sorting protein